MSSRTRAFIVLSTTALALMSAGPASAQAPAPPDTPPTCDPLVNCPPPGPGNPGPGGLPPIPVPCSDPTDPYCTTWVDPIQVTSDCAYAQAFSTAPCPYIHVGSRTLGYESGPIALPNAKYTVVSRVPVGF